MNEKGAVQKSAVDMVGLGPTTLLVFFGFSAAFNGADAGGLGFAAGRLAESLLLALPLYAVVRYGSARGRALSTVRCLNLLCLMAAGAWLVFAAAYPLTKQYMAAQTKDANLADYAAPGVGDTPPANPMSHLDDDERKPSQDWPRVGDVVDGFKYTGGDPSQRGSWIRVVHADPD